MNVQVLKEIIKAFAYGKTAAEVAKVRRISLEEAEAIERDNAQAIANKRAELKEAGYIE